MSETIFDVHYPMVCRLLAGKTFDADKDKAAKMSSEEFKKAFKDSEFGLEPLFDLLCGAIVPDWRDVRANELEANLKKIEDTVGAEKTRSSFRNKLLTANKNTFEDALYEIAVIARACSVLDAGSVQLEKPIQDPSKDPKHLKNSDVYGTFKGQSLRIEVTVLHEKPLGTVDLELEKIIKSASIDAGFRLKMRSFLQSESEAGDACALLEQLHAHHVASMGANATIEGTHFAWHAPRYLYQHGISPFAAVQFLAAGDLRGDENTREISYPVSVRYVTPGYLRDDFPNPPGVVDWSDVSNAAEQVPVSKKIRDLLGGKLAQCEAGIINVVALGNPQRRDEDETRYALFGAPFGVGSRTVDEKGTIHVGEARLHRAPKAPFNPADQIADPEIRAEFIEPFRTMSAVWHLRLGNDGRSEVFHNPNAFLPAPKAFTDALVGAESPDQSSHK